MRSSRLSNDISYLLQILVLELTEELFQAVTLGLDANGSKDFSDIGGRGVGVSAEAEEEVSCEILHFGFLEDSKSLCQQVLRKHGGAKGSKAVKRTLMWIEEQENQSI